MHACVIGLPLEIQTQLASALKRERAREDVSVALVLAKIGKSGDYYIHPNVHTGHSQIFGYVNSLNDYIEGKIIVLPYATLPDVIRCEIIDAEKYGTAVKWAQPGLDGWPARGAFKEKKEFQDALFRKIWAELFPPGDLPSANLRMIATLCPRFCIADGALDTCDQIPGYRLAFIQRSGRAMEEYLLRNGNVGPLLDFFSSRGLDYAKTGGVEARLKIFKGGVCIYEGSGYDHLKEGDNTSPLAATRFYFHSFDIDGEKHMALLHAGIHPAGVISKCIYL